MLLHGDELGRTQDGNNNAYAQDNEIAWVHWDDVDQPLVEFTAAIARLRREHPTFRRSRFFTGDRCAPAGRASASTTSCGCTPTARPMDAGTGRPDARSIGMYLNGHGIRGPDARGRRRRRPLPALLQRRADDVPLTLPPGGVRRGLGRRDRHRRRGARDGAPPPGAK